MFRYISGSDRKRKVLQILALISCEPVFKSVHCVEFAPQTLLER